MCDHNSKPIINYEKAKLIEKRLDYFNEVAQMEGSIRMTKYREGYDFYRQVCEKHGLEPINFHYYMLNLSQEQLDAYNERAKTLGGPIEYEVS